MSPATSDEYLRSFHDPAVSLSIRGLAARMAASISTLGFGGAMGLEGPSLYLGATIGSQTQRRLPRLVPRRGPPACSWSPGRPRGSPRSSRLLPPARSSRSRCRTKTSWPVACCCRHSCPPRPDTSRSSRSTTPIGCSRSPASPASTSAISSARLALGVAAGLAARVFAASVMKAKQLAESPSILRPLLAGALLAGIFVITRLATGESLTFGPGYNTIAWALDPDHGTWLVLLVLVLRCRGDDGDRRWRRRGRPLHPAGRRRARSPDESSVARCRASTPRSSW